jgi:nucleotide-binding universal stress UspA family protein
MDIKTGSIVVGVDASELSSRALAWAVEQASAERRSITLAYAIHAVTPAYLDSAAVHPQEARDALRAEGHQVLAAARAEVERRAPGMEVQEVFQFEDPRELLLTLSRSAALVVVGSRGRGKLRSLLLGSVGSALVRHAHCPVVVHRPGNPGIVRHGVLVGADGSEESGAVLEFAYREASLRGLPLTVLHCYSELDAVAAAAYIGNEPVVDVQSERLLLAESVAGFAEKYPDVAAHTETARGLPQEALVRRGKDMNLVVVGAHQAGLLSRALFGSVSLAVVEHAESPVAVVPVSTPT